MTTTDISYSAPTTTTTTTTSDVVRRFVDDVLNHGRFEALVEIIHPNYRYEGPDGAQLHGLDELQALVAGYRAGFSDFHVAITSEVADGHLVAMTMMLSGTHDGEFDGIPATGKRLSLPLAVFTRIEDGRIVEDREFYDTGAMLAQLGLGGVQAG
jgi:steroid delta-isomerase-like uncharacterized protein